MTDRYAVAPAPVRVAGVLLAAGAGRRMGMPKALVRLDGGEPLLVRALTALRDGGLERIVVVLGAAAGQAGALVPDEPWARVVVCDGWDEGMGASLRAGLTGLAGSARPDAALVTLVDLPDVGAAVVRRVLDAVESAAHLPGCLARAAYVGVPGHPVVIGRDWWPTVAEHARGDQGARELFRAHPHLLVECADLATGADRDA